MTLIEPYQVKGDSDDSKVKKRKERIRKTHRNDKIGATIIALLSIPLFLMIGLPLWFPLVTSVPLGLWAFTSAMQYIGYSYTD